MFLPPDILLVLWPHGSYPIVEVHDNMDKTIEHCMKRSKPSYKCNETNSSACTNLVKHLKDVMRGKSQMYELFTHSDTDIAMASLCYFLTWYKSHTKPP